MPVYSFYPQARGAQGEKIDALLQTPDDARDRAGEILAAHPGAAEVSIWCEDVYIGRVGNAPWSPSDKAEPELTASLDRVLAQTAKPKARAKGPARPKPPKAAKPRPPKSARPDPG